MAHGKVSDADLSIGPPFPTAKKDDVEDVSWALSTAEANWNRGDHADAIKWIRRAAEAASEAELDDRALELAKAAADLASLVVHPSEPKAEAVPNTLQSQATAAANAAAPRAGPAAPAAPVPSARRTSPPAKAAPPPPQPIIANARGGTGVTAKTAPPAGAAGDASPPSGRGVKAPAGPRAQAPQAALPKAMNASRASERRAGRRSAHNLADEAARAKDINDPKNVPQALDSSDEISKDDDVELTRSLSGKRPSVTNEARRRRGSKPGTDEKPSEDHPPPAPPEELMRTSRMEVPHIFRAEPPQPTGEQPALAANTEEIDQWPTQSLSSEELTTLTEERREQARLRTAEIPHVALAAVPAADPTRASQALRVIMWRAHDGIHVAPVGTRVNAMTTEVMLVALDPSVDLATWLKK